MAHRAKHRRAALLARAAAGRTIKSDLNPGFDFVGAEPNATYRAARELIGKNPGALLSMGSTQAQADAVKAFLRRSAPEMVATPRRQRERRLLPVQGFLRRMW